MTDKVTVSERAFSIDQYSKLRTAIDSGEWEYSKSKLKANFDSYRFTTWFQVHPILGAVVFVASCLLGLIPAIVIALCLFLGKSGKEQYELAVQQLKFNKLSNTKKSS